MPDLSQDEQRELLTAEAKRHGLLIDEWHVDEYNDVVAVWKDTWQVQEPDENRGLYEGDTGALTAQVVGSREYGNLGVNFTFTPADYDPYSGPDVTPFVDMEVVDG